MSDEPKVIFHVRTELQWATPPANEEARLRRAQEEARVQAMGALMARMLEDDYRRRSDERDFTLSLIRDIAMVALVDDITIDPGFARLQATSYLKATLEKQAEALKSIGVLIDTLRSKRPPYP